MAVIRMLGAFGHSEGSEPIYDSIRYEVTDAIGRERAASPIPTRVKHCRVGILFSAKDVCRKFRGDVYSYVTEHGFLKSNRKPSKTSEHQEVFVRRGARPVSILVFGKIGRESQIQVAKAALEFRIRVMVADSENQLRGFRKIHEGKLARIARGRESF